MSTTRSTKVGMLDDVADEQRSLADQLETLAGHEWATPSLCGVWTVKEVVAHLTLSSRERLWDVLPAMVRAKGDFDRVNADRAARRAQDFTTGELIAQLREMAGVDKRFVLSGRLDPLVDVLVHGQDIMRPLGRNRPMALARVAPALDHAWKSPFVRPAKRFQGIRLAATDREWSRGDGPLELQTTTENLLLIATGRPVGVSGLEGEAAAEIRRRLS